MIGSLLRLLLLVVAFAIPTNTSAQGIEDLTGSWALDRASSTFGPGDPGADRVDILVSPTEVRIARSFAQLPNPSVWTLPLDDSAPPPKTGSALPVDGRLVITHSRTREIVTHVYWVEDDTLFVERSIHTTNVPGFKHTMMFKRVS